jgi:hypothetical protein
VSLQTASVLLEPLPGVTRQQLVDVVREVTSDLTNARTSGDAHRAYPDWAHRSALRLGSVVSPTTVERLVLTPRYWALFNVPGHKVAQQAADVELAERSRAFADVEANVRELERRWSRDGLIVVPDTSFYVTHPQKLEEVDFADVLALDGDDDIHVVVPVLVIDELDRLKEASNRDVRWRAGYTLAVIDRLLTDPTAVAPLYSEPTVARTGQARRTATLEILFDSPLHVRLPIADDELIDRALAVQAFAGGYPRIITYDTGQSTRARAAGLRVVKLDRPMD